MQTRRIPLITCALLVGAAGSLRADAATVAQAFADHCFSPYLTAQTAQDTLSASGARIDFYDLGPFSAAASSPVTGRAATLGTDRRCEVAFDGAHVAIGVEGVKTGLAQEGIDTQTDVPEAFAAQPGSEYIAARQLNPRRIAVVQVGTRQSPAGTETFINVERLIPDAGASQ